MSSAPAHILVADDQADNRGMLVQLLQRAGYRVSEACHGQEALALIKRDRPDLLLLDLMMPVLDGFGVLAALSAQAEPLLPVIVVSAASEREQRLRALALGAHEFLTKPVDREELKARARTLLALKAADERLRLALAELTVAHGALQVAHEAQAAQAEELQAAHEELLQQSEELQAQAEELETLNQELRAVNQHIEGQVAERTEALRAASEQLSAQQAAHITELEAADRYKDEFLGVVSHELRTPLNFIIGFASALEDGVMGPLEPPQHEAVGKILSGSDRMLGLVDDLLDLARIQSGKLSVDPRPTPYTPLVEETLALLLPLASRARVALDAALAEPLVVAIDPVRVVQVLTNLVGNAIKFSPEGARISVRAFAAAGRAVTEVCDAGAGIAPEDLPRLFQPFGQLDMTSTRQASGTGLGLAISKALVEAHGGEIGVRSAGRGHGSTFWFTLPLASGSESQPG